MDKVLNAGAKVTSTCPNIFNEGDLFGVDLKLFSEPAVVELDTLILEEDEFSWFVENLDTHHHETGEVTTSQSDVVQIIETQAELRTDQRVGRWLHLTSHAVWLETEYSSSYVVHIISPTSYHRVSIYFFAWNSSSSE